MWPPDIFRCSAAPGGDVDMEQPQLGVGCFCAVGELLPQGLSPPWNLGAWLALVCLAWNGG